MVMRLKRVLERSVLAGSAFVGVFVGMGYGDTAHAISVTDSLGHQDFLVQEFSSGGGSGFVVVGFDSSEVDDEGENFNPNFRIFEDDGSDLLLTGLTGPEVFSFAGGLPALGFEQLTSGVALRDLDFDEFFEEDLALPEGDYVLVLGQEGLSSSGARGDEPLSSPAFFSGGPFNFQLDIVGFPLEAEAAPVPTPALLPGLLGMGAAALRKRRLAQSEEA